MREVRPTMWHDEADVVVVGSGAAGLTAAFTAANEGLHVLLLEKTAYFGGTTAYSDAAIWLHGDQVTREAGPELIRYLAEQSPWLEFVHAPCAGYLAAEGRVDLGRAIWPAAVGRAEVGRAARLLRVTASVDTFGVAEGHPADVLVGGQALVGRLLAALAELDGARLQTNSPVTELIYEQDRVTGVVVTTTQGTRRIRARSGVVLAAGGFESNAQARREVHGLPGAEWTSAPLGANTGELLDAAVHIGASTDQIEEAWWVPAVLFPNGHAALAAGISGGIFVGHDGRRFADELTPCDRLGRDIKHYYDEHDGPQPIWWICDGDSPVPPSLTRPVPDEAQFREAGLWRSADTIEGLAEQLDLPVDALVSTVDRFNGFADTGVDDDFQRASALEALRTGPFYALKIVLGDLGTKGGVRTDPDARVLGVDGNPLEGLYAAGNTAASVTGSTSTRPVAPIATGMGQGYRSALHLVRAAALSRR